MKKKDDDEEEDDDETNMITEQNRKCKVKYKAKFHYIKQI